MPRMMTASDELTRNKRLLATVGLWCMFLTLPLSLSYHSKLLIRKMQSKPNNATHALNILTKIDAEKHGDNELFKEAKYNNKEIQNIAVAAIRICGNANRHDLALNVYNKYQSEAARAMAISVLGSCNQVSRAVKLLEDDFRPPTAASFNAAIAACGRNGNWQLALDIYDNKMPKQIISTLTTNTLLTVLAKCRQGVHSMDILKSIIPKKNPKSGSESVTYTLVISALVRSNMLTEASEILQDLRNREHYCSPKSIEAMNDLLVSAYRQRSKLDRIEQIDKIRNRIQLSENENVLQNTINKYSLIRNVQNDYHFHEWKRLQKIGKGKESYWLIGTYQTIDQLNITVGCRPHRNPSRNGIQILFFENIFDDEISSSSQKKIGFLLMRNDWKECSSSLLGMFLKPDQRGRGISKVCLSIWVWLCLKGSIVPVTGIIRKPLLALILQHTFGFVESTKSDDSSCGGTLVEVTYDRDDPKCTVLYPISGKSLDGVLSISDMKHQNIKITSRQPSERGRVVRIGSRLYPPRETNLQVICDQYLPKEFWKCDLNCENIQQIFFGR